MTIRELQEKSTERARASGFLGLNRTLGDVLMLTVGELSEALEEYRAGHPVEEIYYSDLCTCKEVDECCPNCGKVPKPEGVPVEIADAVIRLASVCGAYGIDLQSAIELKMKYNDTRSFLHGGKRL